MTIREDEVFNRALRHYRLTVDEFNPMLDKIEKAGGTSKARSFRKHFLDREFSDQLSLVAEYRKAIMNEPSPS
jgi:hypothetical protein